MGTSTQTSVETETFNAQTEELKRKLPFKLQPLNLPGTFTTAAPSDNFDPNTATQNELTKQGLLWKRPSAEDNKSLVNAWNSVFRRKWLAKDRIIPDLKPQVGKTHVLRNVRKTSETSYLSGNWAGSVDIGKWTTALGTWTIPTVSVPPPQDQGGATSWHLSTWVGIDGFNVSGVISSNDVLQAGIDQSIDIHGHVTCVAWFEWFSPLIPGQPIPPYHYETQIPNFPVKPGDVVYCSVQYINHTAGSLYFANETTGQHASVTIAPPPGATFAGNCMEWIAEVPTFGSTTGTPAAFTPVKFTEAIGCGPNGAVGDPSSGDTTNIDEGHVLTATSVGKDTVTITYHG